MSSSLATRYALCLLRFSRRLKCLHVFRLQMGMIHVYDALTYEPIVTDVAVHTEGPPVRSANSPNMCLIRSITAFSFPLQ